MKVIILQYNSFKLNSLTHQKRVGWVGREMGKDENNMKLLVSFKKSFAIILASFRVDQDISTHINRYTYKCISQLKDGNCITISIDAERIFEWLQHPIIINTSLRLVMEEICLSIIKAAYYKLIVIIMLNGEKFETFPLRS